MNLAFFVIVNGDGAKLTENTVADNNGTAMTVNGNDATVENSNFTGNKGDGGAHNNMPPYVVKYCWERTA